MRVSSVQEKMWWPIALPRGLLGAFLEVPGPAWLCAAQGPGGHGRGMCQKQFLRGSDKFLVPTSFPHGGASGGWTTWSWPAVLAGWERAATVTVRGECGGYRKPFLSGWPVRVGPEGSGRKESPWPDSGCLEETEQACPDGWSPRPQLFGGGGSCPSDNQRLLEAYCLLCALALSPDLLATQGGWSPSPPPHGPGQLGGPQAQRRGREGLDVTRGSAPRQPGSALQPHNSCTPASFNAPARSPVPPAIPPARVHAAPSEGV